MLCTDVSMLSSALSGNSCSARWIRCFIHDATEMVEGWQLQAQKVRNGACADTIQARSQTSAQDYGQTLPTLI